MIIEAALFLLGVYFSVRTIAAFYRVLDLWYTIRSAWPKATRGILAWTGATVLIAELLPASRRSAFVWGFAAYVAFYVAVGTLLSRVVMPRIAARSGEEDVHPAG